jgi:lantibiotic biosynthesis protein
MSSEAAFLSASVSIGSSIVADAIWHDGRCSWVGAVMDQSGPSPAEYRSTGPNLYGGSGGVGLFLAQLAAATAEPEFRRTATGALRQTLAQVPSMPPARRDGLHGGALGAIWAVARAARLLEHEELHAGARTAVTRLPPAAHVTGSPDVATGAAGSVLALLALADEFDDPQLVDRAIQLGEALRLRATTSRHGWSWAIPGRRYPHHLCGLAHGAAGIGWALVELYAATGEGKFAVGATGAFAYERSWLDAASGTWPDLRMGGHRGAGGERLASPAVGTWCHGEGGIALTRLRALAVLGPDACLEDAELALETTTRSIAAALPYEFEDLSLCHGVAGAADVLLCGAAALGGRWQSAVELAARVGQTAIERHATLGVWPCGIADRTSPGLFRGLSGIGWWFLRLADQATPSPLTMPIPRLTGGLYPA